MRRPSSRFFLVSSILGAGGVLFACALDDGTVPVAPADAAPVPDSGIPEASSPDGSDAEAGAVTKDIQILDLASLRGQLDPISEVDANGDPQTFGGLEVLAGYFAKDRAETPATVVLTGGDVVGSTPPLSALFDDAPTIEGMNLLGAAAATFGPHDFERGDAFLQARIAGSVFRWVTSDLTGATASLGARAASPFVLVDVPQSSPRVKIAILGLSDPALLGLVPPGALTGATLADAVTATNAAAIGARAAGAQAVIALAHFGATASAFAGPTGPLLDYANQVRGVDVVFGGRTDFQVDQTLETGTLLVQNRDAGRTYAKVKLHLEAGAVTAKSAVIVEPKAVVTAHLTDPNGMCGASGKPACRCQGSVVPATDVPCAAGFTCDATSARCTQVAMAPEPAATALLKPWRDKLQAALDGRIGKIQVAFTRDGTLERSAEAPIGDFVADALLEGYAGSGAQIALVDAATLTSGLPSSYAPVDTSLARPTTGVAPFDLVAGDSYATVAPGAAAVVRQISGQVLRQVLEASVGTAPQASPGFLQVAGLFFTYKASAPSGARVQTVTLANGTAIAKDDATLYTVVMTAATSRGDGGYPMLTVTPPVASRRLLADILRDYAARVSASGPIVAPAGGRITKIP